MFKMFYSTMTTEHSFHKVFNGAEIQEAANSLIQGYQTQIGWPHTACHSATPSHNVNSHANTTQRVSQQHTATTFLC